MTSLARASSALRSDCCVFRNGGNRRRGRGRLHLGSGALDDIDDDQIDRRVADFFDVLGIGQQEFAAPERMIEPRADKPLNIHAHANLICRYALEHASFPLSVLVRSPD